MMAISSISSVNTILRRCNIHRIKNCSPETDASYLQSKFRRNGVSFTDIGDRCVVGMELENGSTAKLMLPGGLITSFKPQMWHGGTMELLHTSVSEAARIQGGLSLALRCESSDAGHRISWSPDAWTLHQLTGNPEESFQVELISTSEDSLVQFKHVITLEQDLLKSEIIVTNSTTSSLHLLGSTLCHLAVSTPDATYAIGLEGSDYSPRPPLQGEFTIIPPDLDTNTTDSNKFWQPLSNLLLPKQSVGNADEEQEEEGGEEDDNYKHLTQNFSWIYTSAPRSLTLIDRGRRNSVTVRRQGFEELYLFSPGSEHEWYGKYSYICIGHAALLQPLILDAQTQWTGEVQLFNPNFN